MKIFICFMTGVAIALVIIFHEVTMKYNSTQTGGEMKINNITAKDHTCGRVYFFSVGDDGVKEIIEHRAQGEGDRWYYDIIMENNRNVRLFDFYSVGFSEVDEVPK